MCRIEQVTGFQIKRDILIQFSLWDKVESRNTMLHDVLIPLRPDCVNFITDIIENQSIDKATISTRIIVWNIKIDNPRCRTFQLRTGSDRSSRHFSMGIDVWAIKADRKTIHTRRTLPCRTGKEILTYFQFYSRYRSMIWNIFIRQIITGTGNLNAWNRIFYILIKGGQRNKFCRSRIEIPLQIKVIVIGWL